MSDRPPQVRRVTRISAHTVCRDDADRILLCRIALGSLWPGAGEWTLPGGGIEFGEAPAAAALRELTEETGLQGEITGLAEVASWHGRWQHPADGVEEDYHAIRVMYRVRVTGGELRPEIGGSSDLAAWLTRAEAEALPLVDLARIGMRLAFD